jgi:hypothetical protein
VVDREKITATFRESSSKCPEFIESANIVRNNSRGSIWLIGGYVYRSVINQLYGISVSADVDFDFIVENLVEPFDLPGNWNVDINSYGNPKFKGPLFEIDLIPLGNIHSIQRRGIEPTIENFLTGTPLTVQAIALDLLKGEVIGEIGIQAISSRTVGINNEQQARHSAILKGKTVHSLIQDVANSLNFAPVVEDR